ncbi:MAG: M20/M25/M40 family metallo-hydrolase [Streptosporangiaceae bacterium]
MLDNPQAGGAPVLVAHRHEASGLPTMLTYGHADVVIAEAHRWRAGLDPWPLTVEQDRWYGRGTADNKGQHSINLAALGAAAQPGRQPAQRRVHRPARPAYDLDPALLPRLRSARP